MSRNFYLIALVFAPQVHAVDDWLELAEPEYHLRGSVANFSDQGQVLGLQLQVPFVAYSELHISVAQQTYTEPERLTSDIGSLAWQSDPLQDVGLGFVLEQMTSSESYDQTSGQLNLRYQLNPHWRLGAQFGFGNIDFHLQSLDITQSGLTRQAITAQTDRFSAGLNLMYMADTWGVQVSARYDDIKQLGDSEVNSDLLNWDESGQATAERRILEAYHAYLVHRFVERGLTLQEAKNRSNLLFISFREQLREQAAAWVERQRKVSVWLSRNINSQLHWQQSLLTNYEIGVSLFKVINAFQFEVGLRTCENYLVDEVTTQFYSGANYTVSQTLDVALGYGQVVDDNDDYFELSLGWSW